MTHSPIIGTRSIVAMRGRGVFEDSFRVYAENKRSMPKPHQYLATDLDPALTLILVHVPRIESLVVDERVDGAHQSEDGQSCPGPRRTGVGAHHCA
jgi:hypothetical protein